MKLEKPMFNVVYRWLWNASDAQEVTQEAFFASGTRASGWTSRRSSRSSTGRR